MKKKYRDRWAFGTANGSRIWESEQVWREAG